MNWGRPDFRRGRTALREYSILNYLLTVMQTIIESCVAFLYWLLATIISKWNHSDCFRRKSICDHMKRLLGMFMCEFDTILFWFFQLPACSEILSGIRYWDEGNIWHSTLMFVLIPPPRPQTSKVQHNVTFPPQIYITMFKKNNATLFAKTQLPAAAPIGSA